MGSAPCFEVQVTEILIGACLLPPSTINPRQLHQPHYLLDNRRLSLWCGVIMGSRGFRGMLAIFEWNLPAFVQSYFGTVVPFWFVLMKRNQTLYAVMTK